MKHRVHVYTIKIFPWKKFYKAEYLSEMCWFGLLDLSQIVSIFEIIHLTCSFLLCVCVCLCCPHEQLHIKCVECPERPNLGVRSLESGIKRDWKPSWGALNLTWGFCEKIKCSCLRSHLIEPELSTHNGNNITLASLWLQRLDCLHASHFFHPGKHCSTPC